ncbi:MAG TPA: antibiotic biosynthesis monooxygenase family protein [Bacteroidia bacterium]|nr:antibiotic biosynthesis monooxygenase family protein [Bacteroidia bacterium]
MIKRIVKMTFRTDATDAFRKLFAENRHLIAGFPGCRSLELHRESNRPEVFFTISVWESESDLENYRRSELFVSVWVRTKVMFAEKAEAWTLKEQ